MEPLSPDAQRIVELARAHTSPDTGDRRRVRTAVGLVMAATVAMPVATAAAEGSRAVAVLSGLRAVVSALAVASVTAVGVHLYVHSSQVRPRLASEPIRAPSSVTIEKAAAVEPSQDDAPLTLAPKIVVSRSASPASGLDPLVSELSLLRSAREAWQSGNAERALDLARTHARRYPRTQLGSERDALEVFALCDLGRTNEARNLANAVIDRTPASPVRAALEQSCALRTEGPRAP